MSTTRCRRRWTGWCSANTGTRQGQPGRGRRVTGDLSHHPSFQAPHAGDGGGKAGGRHAGMTHWKHISDAGMTKGDLPRMDESNSHIALSGSPGLRSCSVRLSCCPPGAKRRQAKLRRPREAKRAPGGEPCPAGLADLAGRLDSLRRGTWQTAGRPGPDTEGLVSLGKPSVADRTATVRKAVSVH